MKQIIGVIFLVANLQSFAIGMVLDKDTCTELSSSTLKKEFSPDAEFRLARTEKADFIKTIKESIQKHMGMYCVRGVVPFDDFKEKLNDICKSECVKQASVFKAPLLGENAQKNAAINDCHSICQTTYDKWTLFKEGADFGKKLAEKESSDCSGAVLTSGRDRYKEEVGTDHLKATQFNSKKIKNVEK